MSSRDENHRGLQGVFTTQRAAVQSHKTMPLSQRLDLIDGCISLLNDNADALVEAVQADYGSRPGALTLMYDILGSISSLKYARKHVKQWMQPEVRRTPFPFGLSGAKVHIDYQAKGVIGVLGTWNFPIFTLFSPLAQVIAAGNRCVLKPSDIVPHTAELLCALLPNYVDREFLAVVSGDVSVSKAFSELPFDHLVLTGGTEVGKAVMAAAVPNLTPLTLELGGKSPVLIGRSAALAKAAEKIIFAKTVNNGQLCVSPDYVLLAQEQLDEFIEACQKYYSLTFKETHAEIGAIVNEKHYQRVNSYLRDARAKKVRVIALADPEEQTPHSLALHLVINPTEDCLISKHEIFGPAMIVKTYDNVNEAVDFINAGEKPLALYYFGRDSNEQSDVLERTRSGGVTINQIAMHPGAEDAPFGGIGASGMGQYHGKEGFLEFSHARTVYTQGWFDLASLFGMRAPFNDKLRKRLESSLKK
ncbi:MAG: aldehyde dehydrogenase family protein [Pseudomonadales bacterium]